MANPNISINGNVNPRNWGYNSITDLHQEAVDISLAIEAQTSLTRKSKPENMLVNIVEFPNQRGNLSIWFHVNWIGSHQTPRIFMSEYMGSTNVNSYCGFRRLRTKYRNNELHKIVR